MQRHQEERLTAVEPEKKATGTFYPPLCGCKGKFTVDKNKLFGSRGDASGGQAARHYRFSSLAFPLRPLFTNFPLAPDRIIRNMADSLYDQDRLKQHRAA